MSDVSSNLNTLERINQLEHRNFKICSVCHYKDQSNLYTENGVDFVYQFNKYVGQDYVEQAEEFFQK